MCLFVCVCVYMCMYVCVCDLCRIREIRQNNNVPTITYAQSNGDREARYFVLLYEVFEFYITE